MKAWLLRKKPPGERIELPEGSATLVLGRSAKATLVFDDKTVVGQHVELKSDGTFWRVRDLGSPMGTFVNRVPVSWPRALMRGDVISFGNTQLEFGVDAPLEHPQLVATIAADPDQRTPWLVYADWLNEHGDPLGLRIARALNGERLDHHDWMGPLVDDFSSGALEVSWQYGLIRSATLRRVAGRPPLDWQSTVSTLLSLRVGTILQRLSIDLPRLTERGPGLLPSDVAGAQAMLQELPTFPSTLKELSLGLLLGARAIDLPVSDGLLARAPGLLGKPVFSWARVARLRLLESVGAGFDGLVDGVRPLTAVTRLRRGTSGLLHLETPPGPGARTVDGNPTFLRPQDGGWELIAARLKGEVRVNGQVDATFWLVPGDVIEVRGSGRLAYEIDR